MQTFDDCSQQDAALTRLNRDKLKKNINLLYWYKNLYACQFNGIGDIAKKVILEVGSGTSPLRLFYDNIRTSDVLALEHVDHRFDCHQIDTFTPIADESVDIITLTNVLHHLKDPVSFLVHAAVKLKPGGQVIFAEPYFSLASGFIYKYCHHEPSVFDISAPVLDESKGPLSSANVALPYLIFFEKSDWSKPLTTIYNFSARDVQHYTSLAYMITGGISRKIPLPHHLYKGLFSIDILMARIFPRVFSSFFIMKLIKKPLRAGNFDE